MVDFNSPTWAGVHRWAEQQLSRSREKNDAVGLSDTETAALRGEIRMLKRLLALPKEAAREVPVEPVDE